MRSYLFLIVALLGSAGCGGKSSTDHTTHNTAVNAADHNSMGHGNMNHSAMKSSPGAASAPIELQFLDTMIVHHQGAVEMAKLAETRGEHLELKQLASNIVKDQESEITKMREWRAQWFGEKPEAVNMEFPGMSTGMRGMDSEKLAALKGREFDVEFIRQMIPHHEGALEMAKHMKEHDSNPELKQLADDITKAQEAEIKQMRDWLAAWEK